MDKQKSDIEKYEHELDSLLNIRKFIVDYLDQKISEVEEKIAECKNLKERL